MLNFWPFKRKKADSYEEQLSKDIADSQERRRLDLEYEWSKVGEPVRTMIETTKVAFRWEVTQQRYDAGWVYFFRDTVTGFEFVKGPQGGVSGLEWCNYYEFFYLTNKVYGAIKRDQRTIKEQKDAQERAKISKLYGVRDDNANDD